MPDVSNGNTIRVRTGECKRCGQCCQLFGEFAIRADKDLLQWMVTWCPDIGLQAHPDSPDGVLVMLPLPCAQYAQDAGDGQPGCLIHGKVTHPRLCGWWPTVECEATLPAGCGFNFQDVPEAEAWECSRCQQVFGGEPALTQGPTSEGLWDNYCQDCAEYLTGRLADLERRLESDNARG